MTINSRFEPTLFTFRIPSDLLKQFKARCARRSVNASEIIRKLIADWLENEKGG